jgi:hypothetical protein
LGTNQVSEGSGDVDRTTISRGKLGLCINRDGTGLTTSHPNMV